MAENVKVAVRVRPFNGREKQRDAKLIIDMHGKTTAIRDPHAPAGTEPKKFAFDFSYWSHDAFTERKDGYLEADGDQYADQQRVFDDLGRGVLANAWEGYNTSLFAYGQTGSGKSYSMVGYGNNKGIVPITCEELFKAIDIKRAEGGSIEFEVSLSMLEIYNEQVHDLLNAQGLKKAGKQGLKVREHPKLGFYVDQLLNVPVSSYEEIDQRIQEGTRNRTVASTNMNATSSRAHTVVTITFKQKFNKDGTSTTKQSTINLVDLAGSERADSTGATGDRLKEGSAINLSLSSLGNVIKALADASAAKNPASVKVPYRDSVLTKLLKNALSGNSKTIMIAALSPADINYEETLSTLRFADRAKSIKTTAVVNESPTERLIRELREENQRLIKELKSGNVVYKEGSSGEVSAEERERLKKEFEEQQQEEIEQTKQQMQELEMTWKQRLEETRQKFDSTQAQTEKTDRKTKPHLGNLNEDPQLSDMVHHFLIPGKLMIGNNKKQPPPDIVMIGLSIQDHHAELGNDDGKSLRVAPQPNARVLVNGEEITAEKELHHNDRVLFGNNHLYLVNHPQELAKMQESGTKAPTFTYEEAQAEIAKNSGFDMDTKGKSKEDLLIQEDLMSILPMVSEANAMSEELNKKVKFEVVLISPQALAMVQNRTEVFVRMRGLTDDSEWLWPRSRFLDRKFLMQEMYQKYVDSEPWDQASDKDPFYGDPNEVVEIGYVFVYTQCLGYLLDMSESLTVANYMGKDAGQLHVSLLPCKQDGQLPDDTDDLFIEDASELVGERMDFLIKIQNARGIPPHFQDVHCKYTFFMDKEHGTPEVSGTSNPEFNYSQHITYNPVTQQIVTNINEEKLRIAVFGRQKTAGTKLKHSVTTKSLMKHDMPKSQLSHAPELVSNADEVFQLKCDVSSYKRRHEREMAKLVRIKKLVAQSKEEGKDSVPVEDLEKVLSTRTQFRALAHAARLVDQVQRPNSPSKTCLMM